MNHICMRLTSLQASFKILAEYGLPGPIETLQAHVFQSPHHTPLILFPGRGLIHLSSINHFKPRKPPSFPVADDQLAEATKNLNLEGGNQDKVRDEMPSMPCWTLELDTDAHREPTNQVQRTMPILEACTVEENGRLLIGVGAKEGIWIWRMPQEEQLRPV